MPAAVRFQGFQEHVTTFLGEVERVLSAQSADGNRGYDLVFCHQSEMDVWSVVTNGLRFQELDEELPEELVCSVRTGQQDAAQYLVDTVAQMVLGNGAALEYGRLVPGPEPLLPGTAIQGIIALAHPYAPDEFDLLKDAYGTVELQLVTLVPVTKAESDYLATNGVEPMHAKWQEAESDLLDIYRPSAV